MIFGIQATPAKLTLKTTSQTPLSLSEMKTGQLIRAMVIDLLPHGKARLSIGGHAITAKTDLPLTPGADLLLEVSREKDMLSFKPVDPVGRSVSPGTAAGTAAGTASSNPAEAARARLFSGITLFPEVGKIREPAVRSILYNLALKSGDRDDGFLPRLLENLGLALEKKIATLPGGTVGNAGAAMEKMVGEDLKAAVLHLLSGETDSQGAKTLKGIANAFDQIQQLNSQTGESGRFLLPFPIPAGSFFDFGQLFVNTGAGGKGGGEDRVIKIAFLLGMSALGRVRADFSILKRKITGGFLLEDQATCDYLNSLLPELKARLAAIDYRAGHLECRVAPERELAEDALVRSCMGTDPMDPDTGGLDLVI